METHGGGYVLKSHVQETRKDNITKAVQKISHPGSLPTWQTRDTTGDVEAPGHVGSAIKKIKKDDRTVSHLEQKRGQ